jgi:hypothetical protein
MGPQTRQVFLPAQRKLLSSVREPCKSATPSLYEELKRFYQQDSLGWAQGAQ